jgi:hypothetical protein
MTIILGWMLTKLHCEHVELGGGWCRMTAFGASGVKPLGSAAELLAYG